MGNSFLPGALITSRKTTGVINLHRRLKKKSEREYIDIKRKIQTGA